MLFYVWWSFTPQKVTPRSHCCALPSSLTWGSLPLSALVSVNSGIKCLLTAWLPVLVCTCWVLDYFSGRKRGPLRHQQRLFAQRLVPRVRVSVEGSTSHPFLWSLRAGLLVQWEWQRLSAIPSKSGIISPLRLIWCDSVKIARVTKVLPKPHCVPLVLVIETSQPGTLLPVMVIIFSCSAASSGGLVPHLLLWNCPMSGDLTASAVWPVCPPSFGVRCCQQIKASDWFASLSRCYVPCRALCQPRGAAVC